MLGRLARLALASILVSELLVSAPRSRAQGELAFVADGPRTFLALPGRGATLVLLLPEGLGEGRRLFVLVWREGDATRGDAAPNAEGSSVDGEGARMVEIGAGARRVAIAEVPVGDYAARLLVVGAEGTPVEASLPIRLAVRPVGFEPPLPGPPSLYGSEEGEPFFVPAGTRLSLPQGVVCAIGGDVGSHAPVLATVDDRLACRDEEGRDVPAPAIAIERAPTFPTTVPTSGERRFPEAHGQMLAATVPSASLVSLRAPTPDPAQLASVTAGLAYVPVPNGSDVARFGLTADVSFLGGRGSLTVALPIAVSGEPGSPLRAASGDLLLVGTAELRARGLTKLRLDLGSFVPTQRGSDGLGRARLLASFHVVASVGDRHLLRTRQAGLVEASDAGALLFASAYGWDVRLSREDRWSLGMELDTSFGRDAGATTTSVSSLVAATLAFDAVQLWVGGRVALTNDAERALGRGALLFGLRGAAF